MPAAAELGLGETLLFFDVAFLRFFLAGRFRSVPSSKGWDGWDGHGGEGGLGRWGVRADVGGAVAFLAGDAAAFMTGQHLHVNGGLTVA